MAVAGKAAITMDGTWSSTKTYDRLCAVVHNNNLYVSRKQPPVGVEPSNGEYWVLCIEGWSEPDYKSEVKVRNANNGYGRIFKNNSASADYGTEIVDTDSAGAQARLLIKAGSASPVSYYDKNGNGGAVHGTFNKPFGSYSGNGSASPRTIQTGGIGRLLLVYKEGSDIAALVTPQGAFVKNIGEADGTQASSAYYVNGVFYIATTSAYFNQSGATYYYQVI